MNQPPGTPSDGGHPKGPPDLQADFLPTPLEQCVRAQKKIETPMRQKRQFSTEEARSIGMQLNINWSQINLEQFRRGPEVELEHGTGDAETNVTGDDLLLTRKIAWAHLKEIQNYYTRLDLMEAKAEEELKSISAKQSA